MENNNQNCIKAIWNWIMESKTRKFIFFWVLLSILIIIFVPIILNWMEKNWWDSMTSKLPK